MIVQKNKQEGFTIVELLTAMLISLFLLAGVVQVYMTGQRQFRLTQGLGDVQEAGRVAMEVLGQELRMAGFVGCQVPQPPSPANPYEHFSNNLRMLSANTEKYNFSSAISAQNSPTGSLNGSDTFILKGALDGAAIGLTGTTAPPSSGALALAVGNGFNKGDILVVSDCAEAAVFQVSNNDPNTSGTVQHDTIAAIPGNIKKGFVKLFDTDAQVLRLSAVEYYLKNNIDGEPALFRKVNEAAEQEFVTGIEDMQVTYGLDLVGNDNSADRYVDSFTAIQERDLVSVRIQLLIRSSEANVLEENQVLTFNGASVPTARLDDRRVRQVFSTTIALRNRTTFEDAN